VHPRVDDEVLAGRHADRFDDLRDVGVLEIRGDALRTGLLIARRRAPVAREIFAYLGGASPILANTRAQAAALQQALGDAFRVFVAMRHWHPFAAETAEQVKAWLPDRVLLLPLYPQYSTTTTASSFADWQRAARTADLRRPTQLLCCYPRNDGFVAAVADPLRQVLAEMPVETRVLFSAHGLPQRIVDAGDPYSWQVGETVDAVRSALGRSGDSVVCYQSRVGRLQWLEPSIEAEIRRAGAERRPLVVVPIAFTSEHSETLVELDRDYRKLAGEVGVPIYRRVPTVGTNPLFIAGLAELVRRRLECTAEIAPVAGVRFCPAEYRGCPCAAAPTLAAQREYAD